MSGERGWIGCCAREGVDDLRRVAADMGALGTLTIVGGADELRGAVLSSEPGSLGVLIGMMDGGVSDVNLAAAVVRDGSAGRVVLVRRGASGSLRSRASAAGIDAVADPADSASLDGVLATSTETPSPRAALVALEERAPVVALCSGRGGVGKTALVAAMACIAARWGMRVAAMDMDLSCGNLHSCFGVRAAVDPTSVAVEGGRAADVLFSASCGVSVSAPCSRPEMAELVMPRVAELIATATRQADLVLVDTSTTFTDAVAQSAQMADRLMLVGDGAPGSMAAVAPPHGTAVPLCVSQTRIARLENRANPHVRADFSAGRAEVGLEAARIFRVFDGGDEVCELMAAGQVRDLVKLSGPFSRSVAATLAQVLSELGRLPDVGEARQAAAEQTTKRWPFPFGSRREAV